MIKRQHCFFFDHQESFEPHEFILIDGVMKIKIPTRTSCKICSKMIKRKLYNWELMLLFIDEAILDDKTQ
jgi:hypothetical protein